MIRILIATLIIFCSVPCFAQTANYDTEIVKEDIKFPSGGIIPHGSMLVKIKKSAADVKSDSEIEKYLMASCKCGQQEVMKLKDRIEQDNQGNIYRIIVGPPCCNPLDDPAILDATVTLYFDITEFGTVSLIEFVDLSVFDGLLKSGSSRAISQPILRLR